jgi:DNA repair photolyase
MGLNKSKGNMYPWITGTWNTIKGKCYHDCSYCYMKRWGNLKDVRFDESELKTDLGKDNFIFVGSSCDMFAQDIPDEWIKKTLKHCEKYESKYLFQSKNPSKFLDYIDACVISDKSIFCTTIETNRQYKHITKNSPLAMYRAIYTGYISEVIDTYVTIEPIMNFDIFEMIELIKKCNPKQVNIGADSGGNNLPEPPKEKILELITEIEKFTKVKQKENLNRLLK